MSVGMTIIVNFRISRSVTVHSIPWDSRRDCRHPHHPHPHSHHRHQDQTQVHQDNQYLRWRQSQELNGWKCRWWEAGNMPLQILQVWHRPRQDSREVGWFIWVWVLWLRVSGKSGVWSFSDWLLLRLRDGAALPRGKTLVWPSDQLEPLPLSKLRGKCDLTRVFKFILKNTHSLLKPWPLNMRYAIGFHSQGPQRPDVSSHICYQSSRWLTASVQGAKNWYILIFRISFPISTNKVLQKPCSHSIRGWQSLNK